MSKKGNRSKKPKHSTIERTSRRPRRRAVFVAAAALVALAAGGLWVWQGSETADAGTPQLTVDRTDVDLGYVRFNAPARAVFTLTNSGDAPLRVTDVPIVKLVAGC